MFTTWNLLDGEDVWTAAYVQIDKDSIGRF